MRKSYFVEFVIIIVILAIAVTVSVFTSFNDTEYIVTVTDKERVVSGESSSYLVFTEDEQGNVMVFENTDNLLRGKFDSSNIQGQLKVGNTYKVVVVGYRVPFLSMYQNIIEIEGVENV
jgi:hypothetical protein